MQYQDLFSMKKKSLYVKVSSAAAGALKVKIISYFCDRVLETFKGQHCSQDPFQNRLLLLE